jgi:hypothetical protein
VRLEASVTQESFVSLSCCAAVAGAVCCEPFSLVSIIQRAHKQLLRKQKEETLQKTLVNALLGCL